MQVTLNGAQARALGEAIDNFADGEYMTITQQGDGTVVVGFSLATVTIFPDGEAEEN